MPYVGSKEQLNTLTGVAEIIYLTESLESEYANKIFKANLFFKKESTGLIYLSDGVKSLSQLDPITADVLNALIAHQEDTNLHIDAELKAQINATIANVATLVGGSYDITDTLDNHINNADIHVSSDTLARTYATKQELEALYATKQDLNELSSAYATAEAFNNHVSDNNVHITAADRAVLSGLSSAQALTDAELDDFLVGIYS